MPIADPQTRAAAIHDLRRLANFLESNPGLPLNETTALDVVFFPPGDDAAQVEAVADAAQLLGQFPRWSGGHYLIEHRIGRAAYRAVHIPARERARHRALMSYADNIRPEELDDAGGSSGFDPAGIEEPR